MKALLAALVFPACLAAQEATLRVHPAAGLVPPPGGPDDPTPSLASLARFAAVFITPRLRDGEEVQSLGDKTIVALARPAQHEWLERFLAANRATSTQPMSIDCRFIEMDAARWQKLVAPLLEREGKRLAHAILADKAERYFAALDGMRDVRVLSAPRLAMYPTTKAEISMLSAATYVKDFRAEFDAAGRPAAVEPVLGTVPDGMVLKACCGMVDDECAGLSLDASWSEVARPFPKVAVRFPELDRILELERPRVAVAELQTEVRMPLGSTVLFELPQEDRRRHLLLFVTVDRLGEPQQPGTEERR